MALAVCIEFSSRRLKLATNNAHPALGSHEIAQLLSE
jgi:hypothetical protein